MLSYKLFDISNLGLSDYKNQNTFNVEVISLTSNYIELKKFIKKTTTNTKCKFHFIDGYVPIQLKNDDLPFSYGEHIWNTTAILSWDNKRILHNLLIPFSIFHVKDIYPEIVDNIFEYKILEYQDVKVFYVKDLQFRTTIQFNEQYSFDITFKQINDVYKPYKVSDLPKDLWIDLLDKYGDEIEIEGDIEIKYEGDFYYLSYTVNDGEKLIQEEYYPQGK